MTPRAQHGFTLLELLFVISLVSLLGLTGYWWASQAIRKAQLQRAGHQVLEDIKALQGHAERSGGTTAHGGLLVQQRAVLVFDPPSARYAAYSWIDSDADGVATSDETRLVWDRSLPKGVSFGWPDGTNRRACSNTAGLPGNTVSFSSPAAPPCDNLPCIRFDGGGFSVMGPGAIYLRHEQRGMAISGTRAGHFTLCRWNGSLWQSP